MTTAQTAYYQSPVGVLEITGGEQGIASIYFVDSAKHNAIPSVTRECIQQLDEYFSGRRREFSLQLDLQGTSFQRRVWEALCTIPFGTTTSYGAIAAALGDIRKVRAVGMANARNPVSIIVPCHRVIGADGTLVGYGGGLHRKQWLLEFEGAALPLSLPM